MTTNEPTVRSVNAALRKAGIRVYARPPVRRTHDGQLVQSTGYYGSRVRDFGGGEVRVDPEVHVSSYAPIGQRRAAQERTVADHVAALARFACRWDTRFGCLVVTAA